MNGSGYPEVILASNSPRRKELLRVIGLRFRVVPSLVEEGNHPDSNPVQLARRFALAKASAVARLEPEAIVIGADTIVVSDGEVLGKPHDAKDAVRMLRGLSGRQHEVISGLAVVAGSGPARGQVLVTHDVTSVRFRTLSEKEIAAYVASGEAADKAGAYGIQGRASLFVTRIEGCYFNVVGLPVARLGQMLQKCGVDLLGDSTSG